MLSNSMITRIALIVFVIFLVSVLLYLISFGLPSSLPEDGVFWGNTTSEDLGEFNQFLNEGEDTEKLFLITLPEDGASFPRNFAPPEFEWESEADNTWLLRMEFSSGNNLSVLAEKNFWRPSYELWEQIKRISEDKYSKLTVYGFNGKEFSKSRQISFRVSPFPTDQFVVYRFARYPLDFGVQKPSFYHRDITSLESETFFKATDFCFSCHVFSRDEKGIVFSTRDKGTTGVDVVFADREEDYIKIEDENGSKGIDGSMMASWAPGNKKILIQISGGRQNLTTPTDRTCELNYGTNGDISVFDIEKRTLSLLPGASDPSTREFFPDISPDGKTVSFSVQTVKEGNDAINEGSDIYTVPFNNGEGGGATPLEGASEKGAREYFQRYSPDGKWLVFNRVEGFGDAFLETSDLYIIPAAGGEPKMLECSAEGVLDSLAAWSSNSRWIVFGSRRYKDETRLYFAEIDENGNAYSAVKMPNQETGPVVEGNQTYPYITYHKPWFVGDSRALYMLKKSYNEFYDIMDEAMEEAEQPTG